MNTEEASQKERYNILYVDDEQSNLDIFRIAFKREYNIFLANTPTQAIDTLRNHHIHLVITDQKMPEMSGTQFLESTLEEFPWVIRIILTGYADIDTIMQAINKIGIYRYLTKPWDRGEMQMTLEKALESAKLKSENIGLLEELKQANEILEQKVVEKTTEIQKQSLRLEEKNKELAHFNHQFNKSIQYASKIQQALLPKMKHIEKFFDKAFTIYAPRDIVSGDFCWYYQNNENQCFIAVADCTGHGVPGAFMSMIGNTLLNKIIAEKRITDVVQILEMLNDNIIKELKQTETGSTDGIDICLCRFDKTPNEGISVTFAGAKRPLYVIRNKELIELKGTRRSIGGASLNVENTFQEEEMRLQTNDCIYLFTDGWIDTPNEKREKFGNPRFKEMLIESSEMDVEEQQISFLQALAEFKQDTPQRDDILLLGIKI